MIYTLVVRNESSELEKLISFDSITSFDDSVSAQVSKNPVEKGYVISDHMVLDNRKFDVSGVVSSYSVFDEGLELIWNGSAFVSKNEGNATGTEDRHIRIENDIRSLVTDRKVFSLLRSTGNSYLTTDEEKLADLEDSLVEMIDNCVVTSLSFSQGSGSSGAVFPKLQIEQIQVAVTQKEELVDEEQKPLLQKIPKQVGQANTSSTSVNGDGSSTNEKSTDKSTVANKVNPVSSEADVQSSKNATTVAQIRRDTAIQKAQNAEETAVLNGVK